MMARPAPGASNRNIDVYSFGRRSAAIHEQLLDMAEQNPDFLYVYDTIRGGKVGNWREHRMLTAAMMKNSKYFIAFNPSDVGGGATGSFCGEHALSTRYFEGIAGGAVMLGTEPNCPEYSSNFDWPDALIKLDPDGDIATLLEDLNGQQGRVETASKRNVSQAMQRHDWSHRWLSILNCLGLPASFELTERIELLSSLSKLLF